VVDCRRLHSGRRELKVGMREGNIHEGRSPESKVQVEKKVALG
jgi:hypothetical protein